MTHDRPTAGTAIALDPWDSMEMSDPDIWFPISGFSAIRIPVSSEESKDP